MGDKFDEIDNFLIGELCELMFGDCDKSAGQVSMTRSYYKEYIQDNAHMVIERIILEETND